MQIGPVLTMRGHIWFESEVGAGSRFQFKIPSLVLIGQRIINVSKNLSVPV